MFTCFHCFLSGTFGIILLALLIVLGIFLLVISFATCYLFNVLYCYDRIHRYRRKPPETVDYSDYEIVNKDEKDEEARDETRESFSYHRQIIKNTERKGGRKKSSKLPIVHISDLETPMKRRKPRPDSTVLLGQGRLTFSLKYTEDSETLHVHLINGRQITLQNGELAKMPVVKLRIDERIEEEKQSSPDDTPNPEFDEVLSFRISTDVLCDTILNLTVWDSDLNMFKALVGFVRVPLSNFVDSLLRPAGTGPLTREINRNPANDIPVRSNGEMLFSLSYTPEHDKLSVAVLKCRDVATNDDVTGLRVTVSICANGNELVSHSTAAITNLTDLVFNEILTFEPCMKQSNLTNDNISIRVRLHSNTLADEDLIIGEALVGPNTTDEGILHWNEMAYNMRTAVAQWHQLIF
eukprot:Seg3986.4 transcript_id=Seg3986.4/GoldUCD/mRNA.D3Y31 product=Synaptotagmin-15 protein_id=Seg3986.4/GoldUCD/D3Y31